MDKDKMKDFFKPKAVCCLRDEIFIVHSPITNLYYLENFDPDNRQISKQTWKYRENAEIAFRFGEFIWEKK